MLESLVMTQQFAIARHELDALPGLSNDAMLLAYARSVLATPKAPPALEVQVPGTFTGALKGDGIGVARHGRFQHACCDAYGPLAPAFW